MKHTFLLIDLHKIILFLLTYMHKMLHKMLQNGNIGNRNRTNMVVIINNGNRTINNVNNNGNYEFYWF